MLIFCKILGALFYPLLASFLLGITGALYYYRHKVDQYKIQSPFPKLKKILADFYTSLFTAYFFLPAGIFVALAIHYKWGLVYQDPLEKGLPYFVVSLFLLVFVHDTYYYWLHRLMHTSFFYRRFHAEHHKTTNPTLVTFYAIHWVEAIFISFSMPIAIFLFPVSFLALKILLPLHTLQSIFNHCGYEFLPHNSLTKWYNTTLAHNLHHQKSRVNYGYYFTFWDRMMGTFSKDYDIQFEKVLAKRGGKALAQK